MATTVQTRPIAARPPPLAPGGLRVWARRHLFTNRATGLATLLLAALLLAALPPLADWALWRAVWQGGHEGCRAVGAGACWAVVWDKLRLIVFGRYPLGEQWRPLLATGLMLMALVWSATRRLRARGLVVLWLGTLPLAGLLMGGGLAGLSRVDTARWGGLPLTVMLATLASALAFPLAVLLALGRQSALPVLRTLCTVFIEFVRGVPLITVLFVASFMLPLWMPPGVGIDVLLRVLVGITLFAAAYMAEVVRGGLQAVPRGQVDAATALGMGYWARQRWVVLPQALATVVPGLVNNFIGIFKDTSLVTIVSLYELTGALDLALNADALWRPYKLEGYLFIGLIYFVFCFALSRFSQRLERRLAHRP